MSTSDTPATLPGPTRYDSPPLTVERLLAIADALPRPEIVRIIVGAPCIPRDSTLKWITKRVLWLHAATWDAIPKEISNSASPLFGLPVEFFTWEQHGDLWREFMRSFVPTSASAQEQGL